MCYTVVNSAKNRTSRYKLFKFYKMVVVRAFVYGCATWTLSNKNYKCIQVDEMRFLLDLAGDKLIGQKRTKTSGLK